MLLLPGGGRQAKDCTKNGKLSDTGGGGGEGGIRAPELIPRRGPLRQEPGGDQPGGIGKPGCPGLSGREKGERSLAAPAVGG